MSQDDLAFAANVERAYVGHLERETKNPTVSTLEKLAGALGCDISEMFVVPEFTSRPPALKSGRRKR